VAHECCQSAARKHPIPINLKGRNVKGADQSGHRNVAQTFLSVKKTQRERAKRARQRRRREEREPEGPGGKDSATWKPSAETLLKALSKKKSRIGYKLFQPIFAGSGKGVTQGTPSRRRKNPVMRLLRRKRSEIRAEKSDLLVRTIAEKNEYVRAKERERKTRCKNVFVTPSIF